MKLKPFLLAAFIVVIEVSVSDCLSDSCLQCGPECLSAVQSAVPVCIAAGFDYTTAMVGCVKDLVSVLNNCRACIQSLVCCVTDSCSICECDCHNLVQFRAPVFSTVFQQQPWLFSDQCHFAFIGTPPCKDCDGKHVYQSVNCTQSMFLHYHDYIIDGRWVVTETMDMNDERAVVRNKGDGLDDEECPEKETYKWESRSTRAAGSGWFREEDLTLQQFITQEELTTKAKLLGERKSILLQN